MEKIFSSEPPLVLVHVSVDHGNVLALAITFDKSFNLGAILTFYLLLSCAQKETQFA